MGSPAPAIPGFESVSLLGRGGMGEVWKARQKGIDRWVALKILHPHFSQDEEYVRRFQREARTVGKLSHENIVRAYDCGEADGRNYLVMEFVQGEPLDGILARQGVLPEREALAIVRAIAQALQYAWEHRIIHRDIKPQNILMTPEGVPKLCDLGLSRDVTESTRLTQTGAIACTPAYASPEQAQGETRIDTRSDLYSMGVLLYELVTGTLPFQSSSAAALLVKHVSEKPAPPVSRNPALTPGANRLILDMLEKLPARRPTDPGAVVGRIDALLSGQGEPDARLSRSAATRRRKAAGRAPSRAPALALAGGIAAAVLVLLAVALSGRPSAPRTPPPFPPRESARATAPVPVPEQPPRVPEPAPAPTPRPRPAPAPTDRAQAALQAARAFCAAAPDDLPAQIRRYESALLDMTGTPLLEEARTELEAIRARRREELRKAETDVQARVRDAVGKEEFRKAIGIWKEAPARFPDAPWAADSEARIGEVKKAAEGLYPELVRRAAEANRKGDATTLQALRSRVLGWDLPGLTQGFDQAIALPAAPAPAPVPLPAPPPRPPEPPLAAASRRKPPPPPAEQRSLREQVRGRLFKADYAKRNPEDACELARKLLEGARAAEEPATQLVFLQEARDQALRGGDPGLAFSAVDRIVADFEVDPKKEWSDALRAAAGSAREPGSAAALVAEAVSRVRAAIAVDDYDLAAEFQKTAETVAPRAADAAGAAALIQSANQLKTARAAHKAAMPAFQKLKADPENADAHLEVGRFLCFVKGDWSQGGEHLERGSDRTLREAAARERLAQSDPAKLASAADGWVKVSGARDHALDLYRRAWPGLAADRRDAVRVHFLGLQEGPVSDAPAGWYIGSGSRRDLYRVDGGRSRFGKSSLRVESGGGEGWMSVGPFDTVEGREYEFSAWILTDRMEPWNLCSVYFYTEAPPQGKILGGVHLAAPADQPWWTPVRIRCRAPAGATVFQVIVTHGMPKGTAWVDDLSLRAVETGKDFLGIKGTFER